MEKHLNWNILSTSEAWNHPRLNSTSPYGTREKPPQKPSENKILPYIFYVWMHEDFTFDLAQHLVLSPMMLSEDITTLRVSSSWQTHEHHKVLQRRAFGVVWGHRRWWEHFHNLACHTGFLGPSLLKGPVQLFTFCKNCPLQASINDPLPVFYAIALAIFQESKEEECIIKMFQRSFAIMVKMLQRGIIFKGWILRMIKNRSCSWQHQAETDSDLYIANQS